MTGQKIRFMGVDYGEKRTGLAVMDSDTLLAMPYRSFEARTMDEVIDNILAAASELGIDRFVVGLPRRLAGEGTPGETERQVGMLVERLRVQSGRPVETEDERMTTAMVESVRRSVGAGRREIDKDAAAAAIILDSYAARMLGAVVPKEERPQVDEPGATGI